jgi:hypothetical protein
LGYGATLFQDEFAQAGNGFAAKSSSLKDVVAGCAAGWSKGRGAGDRNLHGVRWEPVATDSS